MCIATFKTVIFLQRSRDFLLTAQPVVCSTLVPYLQVVMLQSFAVLRSAFCVHSLAFRAAVSKIVKGFWLLFLAYSLQLIALIAFFTLHFAF